MSLKVLQKKKDKNADQSIDDANIRKNQLQLVDKRMCIYRSKRDKPTKNKWNGSMY